MIRAGRYGGVARIARLTDEGLQGYLAVDEQEWTLGSRWTRRSKRRTTVESRWRISLLSGEYDEGLLSLADLQELDDGLFRYRGVRFRVEWLSGAEAEAADAGHFAGWD